MKTDRSAPPPHTDTPPPHFIIGGAPRSGTTWLYRLLDIHPEIYMAKPVTPEPKFFLVDEQYAMGLERYQHCWFKDLPAGVLAGEKSTNYLESAAACQRIKHHLPQVKLVFILRNPVDRAYSNYCWSVQNRLEDLSFAEALVQEAAREASLTAAHRYSRPYAYFSRGLYAQLLTPWFQAFPRTQILVLRYEDIAADPEALLEKLYAFLGVLPRLNDCRSIGRINALRVQSACPDDVRAILSARYRAANHALATLMQHSFHMWDTD